MHPGWLAGVRSFCVPVIDVGGRGFASFQILGNQGALAFEESGVAMLGAGKLLGAREVGAGHCLIYIEAAAVNNDESACLEVGLHVCRPLALLNHELIMGALGLPINKNIRLDWM